MEIFSISIPISKSEFDPLTDVWMYDAVANTWTSVANYPGGLRAGMCAFSLNGYGYAGCGGDGLGNSYNDMWKYDPIANTWTSIAPFPIIGNEDQGSSAFVIDSLAYVGTGLNASTSEKFRFYFSYSSTSNSWSPIPTLTGESRWADVGFSIGGKGYVGTGEDSLNNYLTDYWEYTPAPTVSKECNFWTQKASLTDLNGREVATGFSIGHNGFIGTGQTTSGLTNDFWKWDQTNNTWSAIAYYPGNGKYGNTSFSINGKGYTCLGWSGSANSNDLWAYDTTSNTWTQMASFPGKARYGAFVFVIGTKAYVGCGEPNAQPYMQDVWMYDAVANTWTSVANYPGGLRSGLCAFTLNGYGYAGCGGDGLGNSYNDMWKYDPIANSWTSVAAYPIIGNADQSPSAFIIDTLAYVGTGANASTSQKFRFYYSYSATTNSWSPIATLTGESRSAAVGFAVGNKGYVGTGVDSLNSYITDYWEYTPCLDTATGMASLTKNPIQLNLYPNPTNGTIHIKYTIQNGGDVELKVIDMFGRTINSFKVDGQDNEMTINESVLSNGMYFYQVIDDSEKLISSGKFIIAK